MIRQAAATRLAITLLAVGFTLGLAGACGGPQEATGVGGECFRAKDCKEGLVCVQGRCTDDLSTITSTVDAPAGPPPDGAADAVSDGVAGAPPEGSAGAGAAGGGGGAAGAAATGGAMAGAGGMSAGAGGAAAGAAGSSGSAGAAAVAGSPQDAGGG